MTVSRLSAKSMQPWTDPFRNPNGLRPRTGRACRRSAQLKAIPPLGSEYRAGCCCFRQQLVRRCAAFLFVVPPCSLDASLSSSRGALFEKGQAVQLTNLEPGTPTNLAKAIRMARRSAAAAVSAVSALHWNWAMRILSRKLSNLASASNAIFPPAIARKLDSLPPMARDWRLRWVMLMATMSIL